MENNVKIVQNAYDKFKNGDISGLLEHLSDDVKWTTPEIENAPFTGERNGIEEIREFFSLLDESEETTQFEVREYIAQGDRVVALGKYGATVKATHRSYASDWVHIFTVKNDKITSFVEFFDNALATRAYQKTTKAGTSG